MEKSHQNLKNKLEKISEIEGVFGVFAYEDNGKIYSKISSEKILKNFEHINEKLYELCSNIDGLIEEINLSLKDSVIQFSENFKIILLRKRESDHNYKLCFLTSRYMDVISIRKYID